jgi:hypothetical protein
MKKIYLLFAFLGVLTLTFGAVGFAYAQNQTPPTPEYPYGPGYSRGMMGGFDSENNTNIKDVSSELSVSPEEALEAAQRYLDQFSPGVEVSDETTPFYGYYTIDLEKDGEIVGMLSVNGFTRQVFPHSWHGKFIEMVEADHK